MSPEERRSAIPPEQIQNASDRAAIDEGCYFDQSQADHVLNFIRDFCCHTKDRFFGKPFTILPWQVEFITRLYGWRRADGRRRFQVAYLEVPKKNGKTELLSALVLYHLAADGVHSSEIYACAMTREQAGLVFGDAVLMVEASADLGSELVVSNSRYCKQIACPDIKGVFKVLSSDAASADGKSSSMTIFDELHRQKNRDLWNVMIEAGAARLEPLLIAITTAGDDKTGICYEQHDIARQISNGTRIDTQFYGVIYGADPEVDDLNDPAVWARVNPSWGVTIDPHDFAARFQRSKVSPSTHSNFLRLRLGVWVQPDTRLINGQHWDECGAPFFIHALEKKACYAGLDLSSTTDTSAFVMAFKSPKDVRLESRIWIPEETVESRIERDGKIPWRDWARRDLIRITEGRSIQYKEIIAEIIACSKRYKIKKLYVDPWNGRQVVEQLREAKIDAVALDQGYRELNAPTKELIRLVAEGELRHNGHPVLSWMAGNARATRDDNDNLRVSKGKSRERVDGIAATINALYGMLTEKPPKRYRVEAV